MENNNIEIKNKSFTHNDKKYKEIKINKMVVNGKEQAGNIISAEETKGKNEINVTVYTQDIKTVPNKRKGNFTIHELFKKGILRNKRQ